MSDEGFLSFSVDARLVAQLGEQLVPSDVTALAELVKNAYDADATIVTIDYHPDEKQPYLIVEDDGIGMTLEDIRLGWMTIGTPFKENSKSSSVYKRPRTGKKGIGRFAAQRLGEELDLWSSTKGERNAIEVNFDWTQFRPGLSLHDIKHSMKMNDAKGQQHGTRLAIRRLSRTWSEDDLKDVLEKLIRLQGPQVSKNQKSVKDHDPGFSVVVSVNGSKLKQEFDEVVLLKDERSWNVKGHVDRQGNGSYQFTFLRPTGKKIRETLSQKIHTGPLEFDIDVFVFKSDSLEKLSTRKAGALGKRYGGCRIWRDGFRVFPFGDPDDDWVGLDAHVGARHVPLTLPRNMNILGGVSITASENPDFIDLLTRRGLVENQAFNELKDFVFEGLKIGANEHAALTMKQSRGGKARSTPSEATIREVEKARAERESRNKDKADRLIKAAETGELKRETFEDLKTAVETDETAERKYEDRLIQAVEETEKEILDENSMLRVLASLGTGLAAFGHELRMVGSSIGLAANDIEDIAGRCPEDLSTDLSREIKILRNGIDDLAAYRCYIDDFIQTSSRRIRSTVEIHQYIKDLAKTFKNLLEGRSIETIIDIQRNLFTIPIHRAELNSIVFNLLTNAIKAMLAPNIKKRTLLFQGFREGDSVCLVVADTGQGIPKSIEDRIFDPFVTRSHIVDDDALGPGTGLGLTIVADIVESYGGSIEVTKPPKGFRTAFKMKIRAKE